MSVGASTLVSAPQHNADMLPPLPESLLLKIKQKKFVNFDLLLPQSLCPSSSDDYVVQVGGGENSSITLVPKSQHNKAKILNFNLWMLAWCTYARVFVRYHGHQTDQLLHYQSLMAQFGQQYVFDEFYLYDRQFRLRLASNPALRWDRIDVELTNQFLRTARVICYNCNSPGHYSSVCPLSSRAGASSGSLGSSGSSRSRVSGGPRFPFSRASQRSSGFSATRPSFPGGQTEHRLPSSTFSRAPGPQHTCWFFNSNGFCTNQRCSQSHTCSSCGGAHPASHCTQRNTARF